MKPFILLVLLTLALMYSSCETDQKVQRYPDPQVNGNKITYPVSLTDEQWKEKLTPAQYYILRQQGTEPAGSGKYNHFYEKGTYYSAASLQPVFSSETKFDSGTGWPSFYASITDAVHLVKDYGVGMERIEVVDSKSGSHLGHVFNDGPPPTGKRYCLNSDALLFVPEGGTPPISAKP